MHAVEPLLFAVTLEDKVVETMGGEERGDGRDDPMGVARESGASSTASKQGGVKFHNDEDDSNFDFISRK